MAEITPPSQPAASNSWLQQYDVLNNLGTQSPEQPAVGQDRSWLQDHNVLNHQFNSQDQIQAAPTDYLEAGKSAAIGATKGAASLADIVLGPIVGSLSSMLPGKKSLDQPPIFSSLAEKYLPEPSNKPAANIAEGATMGAPFGPAGALIGGASTAGTEVLNKIRPESPIANVIEPAAISMFLTPGTANALLKVGRLAGEGAGLAERAPLVQAKIDQGVTAGTPASTTDSGFWRKMQRSLKEALFEKNIEPTQEAEQSQLNAAVNKQADTLGPDVTRQQAGEAAQQGINDGVSQVKRLFSNVENSLDQAVPPKNTFVNMQPYVAQLRTAFTPPIGAEAQLASMGVTPITSHLDPLLQDIQTAGQGFQNSGLSIEAIRTIKQTLGDKLTQSLLNGDVGAKNLKTAYGIMADAQGSAYAGTSYETAYNTLKQAEHEMYSNIENFAEPLVKEGVTPERIATQMVSEMKLGGTKLQTSLDLINSASPALKGQYTSMILRSLGKDNRGDFNPDRFFRNWTSISPEAKVALFGDANGDLPKDYDQLALIAENQARGAKATNFSQTAGTAEVFHLLRLFGGVIGGVTGYEASTHGNADEASIGAFGSGTAGAAVGALAMSTLGYRTMGQMMTNPAFIRWLATPTTLEQMPLHLRALSAVAGEAPEIKDNITAFQTFLSNFRGPQQKASGGIVDHFLGGGYADFPNQDGYNNGGPILHKDKGPFYNQGYIGGGLSANPFGLGAQVQYTDGGAIGDDPRPFYNSQLPRVSGGYAEGGVSENDNPSNTILAEGGFTNSSVMGYTDGGTSDNWEIKNNNFGGIRKQGIIAGPNAGGFEHYDTPEAGLQHISRLLDVYSDRHGLNTLSGIISRWAPSNENNTKLLIQRAAQWTGFDPNTPLDVHDPATKATLIAATIMNEQGGRLPVSKDLINKVANSPINYIKDQPRELLNNPSTMTASNSPSILEHLLGGEPSEEDQQVAQQEATTKPVLEAINAAPWIEAPTKYAASRILTDKA